MSSAAMGSARAAETEEAVTDMDIAAATVLLRMGVPYRDVAHLTGRGPAKVALEVYALEVTATGWTQAEVARAAAVSSQMISDLVGVHGGPRRAADKTEIIRLYGRKYTISQICGRTGSSRTAVARVLAEAGVRRQRTQPSRDPRQIAAIRDAYRECGSLRGAARAAGVDRATVRSIVGHGQQACV